MTAAAWMVRSGRGGIRVDDFLEKGVIAIGWSEIRADLSGKSLDEIASLVRAAFPTYHPSAAANAAGMLHKISSVIAKGDRVATYDSERRLYHLGRVTGPYRYQPELVPGLPHTRPVAWDREISRDVLAPATRNSLGSTLTLFRIPKEALADLERDHGVQPAAVTNAAPNAATSAEDDNESVDDIRERSKELIKDLILGLDEYEMQELLASLLISLGFKARVSPKGPDRGVDVFASPDGLGLQKPRIKGQVKHRPGTRMDAADIRNFIATLRDGDSGVYLSTGGFTKEARYEADRSTVAVSLLGPDDFVERIMDNYHRFDDRGRALVPLVAVFWPAMDDD